MIFVLAGYSCSRDDIKIYDFSNYTVDKVVCQASSNILIADNVSELDLHVKLYAKTGTYTDKYGKQRDQYLEIPKERWRNHDVKFFLGNTDVTPPYKTSTVPAETLKFRAEVDGIKSTLSPAATAAAFPPAGSVGGATTEPAEPVDPGYFEVTVKQPYTVQARKIPVIFHIIDSKDNEDKGQILQSEVIYAIIDQWNEVFGRKNSTAPNGANPNLEFVPALKKDKTVLAEPGINRVTLTAAVYAQLKSNVAWIWKLDTYTVPDYGVTANLDEKAYKLLLEADKLPNVTPNQFWDSKKYLNVWVSDVMAPFSYADLGNYLPQMFEEGVYDETELPLPDAVKARIAARTLTPEMMTMWYKNPYDLRLPPEAFKAKEVYKEPQQAGIVMKKTSLTNFNTDVVQHMGAFLGLIPNTIRDDKNQYIFAATEKMYLDDECEDTPVYNRWFNLPDYGGMEAARDGNNRVKYTLEPPYYIFRSQNIMEYGSSQTVITQDQLRRIEWMLENAHARQMWRDLSAITE